MKELETAAYELAKNDLISEHLNAGRAVRFTIITSSMMPLLAPGDVVTVQPSEAHHLAIGDVVVRPVERIWLTHRLVTRRIEPDGVWYVTKGDNHYCADQPWQLTAREGVVVAAEHAGKTVHFGSPWARRINWVLAVLSWRQACHAQRAGLHDRIIRRTCRLLILIIASTIRRWAR